MFLRILLRALPLALLVSACAAPAEDPDAALEARATALAQRYIIVDGHIDVPYRMAEFAEDLDGETIGGDFDYPRAKAGGLNAPFMSIYLPAERQQTPGAAKALADSLIDMVEGFATRWPNQFAVAHSVPDVRNHAERGVVSLPMGMENGAGIEDDLANLQHFYGRGIRYITLTHSRDNLIGDSSYDTTGTHGGLSAFGEAVVDEMNRLGIMIDVSHISDATFDDVMARTRAPVMASHSSARHFTPGWERNMSDALIRRLAENEGVIMINFGSAFLKTEYQNGSAPIQEQFDAYLEETGLDPKHPDAVATFERLRKAHPVGTLTDVADHIDHVVALVGAEHVGLGSDYDGVTTLPAGLGDVSTYPALIAELLRRGYSEPDIEGILGGNALRVWSEVERIAADAAPAG